MALTPDVVEHLDLCLGCRACETACPSGVRYGELIEDARAYVATSYRRPWWDRWRRRLISSIFPYPSRLRVLLIPVQVLQRSGIWRLIKRAVPAAAILPRLTGARELPEVTPARGGERGRVGLLIGCVAREFFSETNQATARVLARNGWTVVVPQAQGCCGALHLHAGDPATARRFARRNLDAFAPDLEAIIVNAAGCGVVMKEYGRLLGDDPQYADRALAFAAKVRDVTEFLAALPAREPERRIERRVTYHDACHLAHGQQVREAPRALLRLIPGLEVVPLPEAEICCGSAGSYSLVEPGMARRLLERKIANIATTGASCVVAANPGCVLQIQAGLRARGLAIAVKHPVELLDEAYGGQ